MILEKIKYLFKPYKLIIKIINKSKFYYNLKKYDQTIYENKQNNIFKELGLNRKKGIDNLKLHKKNLDLFKKHNMSSEHETILSSISLDKDLKIQNILEIGTFDGVNAFLLSKLFPESKVFTIDLNSKDHNFINFYNRKNSLDEFINKRNITLSKSTNIYFKEINSIKLINDKKKYDLIWIDGAHGYPTVCIDIINSLNLISDNGLILCDDVYTNRDYSVDHSMYQSSATIETLKELKKVNLINFKLIYKRLNPENNCLKSERKFVAIFKKNESTEL